MDLNNLEEGYEDIVKAFPLPDYKVARHVARVFQDPMAGTAAHMTIEENLSLALGRGTTRGLGPGISQAKRAFFREQLAVLEQGLEDRLSTKAGLLSGGQRQALSLVMATFSDPKVLLLDEHTAALDPRTAQKVLTLSDQIIKEHHLMTMMVTHNMKDAIRYGNRLIMMNEGRIILDIKGEEKKNLTVQALMDQFVKASGEELSNDRALLS